MQTKSIRKRVGKPTGETTKAGRPVYKTETGERRSEFSTTIPLANGKWVNIPSIHNGKYYTEKELKKAVEEKRMIPTSEHDSEKEAIEAAKKRSKNLNKGGITLKNYIKAHKGTLINGEIVYPDKKTDIEKSEFITDGLPNPYSDIKPEVITGKEPIPKKLDDGGARPVAPLKTLFPIKAYNELPQVKVEQKPGAKRTWLDVHGPGRPMIGPQILDPRVTTPGPRQILPPPTVNPFSKKMQEYVAPKRKLHQENMKGIKDQLDAGMINEAQAQQMWKAREKTYQEELNKDPEYVKLRDEFFKNQPKPKAVPIKSKDNKRIADYIKELREAKQKFNVAVEPQQQKQAIGQIPWHLVAQMQSGAKNKFNKGGATMEQQMELFDDGGLKDEGGMTDKESGNKVPSGSTRKEVRDDIPAMVSEGEFIFPADVTRYIGLDRLMELRQDAKMGLQKMEMMGQMGNSDEAVLPDDMPFDMDDIIVIDDMAVGGSVDDDDVMNMDLTMAIGGNIGGDTDVMNTDMSMQMAEGGDTTYATKKVKYINDKGEIKYIMHDWMDRPMTAIPAGYTVAPDQSEETEPTPTPTPTPQTPAPDDDDDKLDPMKMQEDAERSAGVTAKRLGMSTEDYLKLPMKTRFALLGQELNVMRGNELDMNVRDQIIQSGGQGGDTGFGLIGGLLGGIGNFFDKDGDGFMFTSTSADGTVTNWYGQVIRQLDKKQLAALGTFNNETGRWSGGQQRTNISNVNRQSNTGNRSSSGSSRKSTTSGVSNQDKAWQADKDFARIGRAKEQRMDGATGYDASAKTKRIRDDNKGIAAENFRAKEAKGPSMGADTGSYKTPSVSKAQKQTESRIEKQRDLAGSKDKTAKDVASRRGFASGTMVTKPKNKPTTQRKTLVKRKS